MLSTQVSVSKYRSHGLNEWQNDQFPHLRTVKASMKCWTERLLVGKYNLYVGVLYAPIYIPSHRALKYYITMTLVPILVQLFTSVIAVFLKLL